MTLALADDRGTAGADAGIVGRRHLAAVQTFSIGRLTSHVVPLVPSRFIAVTGRGPDSDSNGSGKTTFLGAVALLCGDPYWNLAGGSATATGLLFDPAPAGVSAERYPAADVGYIAGCFTHGDGTDPLTVWVRLSAGAPVRARWDVGAHLITGDTEAERHRGAEATWAALPHELRSNFAAALYGDTPRCLAWLESRGAEVTTRPSLLSASLSGFSPDQIGAELVKLCGRAGAADEDVEQRRLLDQLDRDLAERRDADAAARPAEDALLAAVARRAAAATKVAAARRAWRLHYARGWLDLRGQLEVLAANRTEARRRLEGVELALELARAEQTAAADTAALQRAFDAATQTARDAADAKKEAERAEWQAEQDERAAKDHRHDVAERAAAWDGATVAEATAAHRSADEAAGTAAFAVRSAAQTVGDARAALGNARAGRAGRAGRLAARLRDGGVDAVALLDAIDLAEDRRAEWEARLAIYEHAVTVDPADLDAALAGAEPGDVVIAAAPSPAPDGVAGAPAAAGGFLDALAARWRVSADGVAADGTGAHVTGGFAGPITGREARVRAAEAAVETADADLAAARAAHTRAVAALGLAAERLAGAIAAAEREQADRDVAAAVAALAAARIRADAVRGAQRDAEVARDAALEAKTTGEAGAELAATRVAAAEADVAAAVAALRGIDDDEARLDEGHWTTGWGADDPDAAEAALAVDAAERGVAMTEESYRKSATDAVAEVLGSLELGDEATAPTEALAAALADRRNPARATQPGTTENLLVALGEWLADIGEFDAAIAERIDEDRRARGDGIATAAETCAQATASLAVIQDAIVRSVTTRLEAVEAELDRINRSSGRFGAELEVRITPPGRPDERWRWEVTPRWRRSAGARPLDYRATSNAAQAKLFAVHLVVAALFASGDGRGSLLILDELGNSLGAAHRREVLRSLADVAAVEGITVLGTCQDDLLVKASEVCGAEIVFELVSASDPLNAPVRVWGYDDNRARVETTAAAHRAGRALD